MTSPFDVNKTEWFLPQLRETISGMLAKKNGVEFFSTKSFWSLPMFPRISKSPLDLYNKLKSLFKKFFILFFLMSKLFYYLPQQMYLRRGSFITKTLAFL